MTKITKRAATRFQHETASGSDEIDATLIRDFLEWLGVKASDEDNAAAAKRALTKSRE